MLKVPSSSKSKKKIKKPLEQEIIIKQAADFIICKALLNSVFIITFINQKCQQYRYIHITDEKTAEKATCLRLL